MKPIFLIVSTLLLLPLLINSQESEIFIHVKNNDIGEVRALLEQDPTITNERDNFKRTPLHWAARGVFPEIMKELIQNGADVNAKDVNEVTPIISVVVRDHEEALDLLIKNGAHTTDKDIEGDYLIHLAASYGLTNMARILLEHDDVLELRNSRDRTPLILACRESGNIEMVKYLVSQGADINAVDKYGGTALSLAAWRGYEAIVNFLIDEGALIDLKAPGGIKLMQYACDKNLLRLYDAIISRETEPGALELEGQNALHWSSMGGSEYILSDLISRGMDVNARDLYGWMPLHYASWFGRDEVVAYLVENGADIEAITPLNETAYILAFHRGNSVVTSLLSSSGADITIKRPTLLSGKYFGQGTPGKSPELFAPGIASRLKGGHSNITFSEDGKMAFWTEWNLTDQGYSDGSRLLYSRVIDDAWTYPEVLYQKADCPVFSPDGSRMYFLASLPGTDGNDVKGIWYYAVEGNTLSDPIYLDFDVQKSGLYWQFSFDNEQNLYFGGLHGLSVARYSNGKFEPPQKLSNLLHPDYEGGSPQISPDGDFLIFNSGNLEHNFGGSDLYVGFRMDDGTWSAPVNLGPQINSPQSESLARLSLDGKYLFYKTNFGSIRWVDISAIERLRPE